jgi:NTE family protein
LSELPPTPPSRKTAFVLAGGGSFGAVQAGMLQALTAHGVRPDLIIGSSVGAMNGAHYAGVPTVEGAARLASIWRGLSRQDVFPFSLRTLLSVLWRRDFLISHEGLRKLVDDNLPYKNLEEAQIPIHIVTTNVVSGDSVVLSDGPATDAILASTSIPGAFEPIKYNGLYLADGAISNNTPIRTAIDKGATRLIILPTGYACSSKEPPVGMLANVLHAITLLVARQMTSDLEDMEPEIDYVVVPPLCPMIGTAYDFSHTGEHIERAAENTEKWIAQGGLEKTGIPGELRLHTH